MEKQKLIDFDFKKIIPLENSEAERKISKVITKKFLALSFVIAFGFGLSSHMYNTHIEHIEKEQQVQNEKNMLALHNAFVMAKENKDAIVNNLEQQVTIYDDMIKDIFEVNQHIPNSAQTILNQNAQIRNLSQAYKKSIADMINNFNTLVSSEDLLKKASVEEQNMFIDSVKGYQVGSLNRNLELENLLMSYTTTENDEKEVSSKAQPLRQDLKSKIVEKMSSLLTANNNETTKFKKLKIK